MSGNDTIAHMANFSVVLRPDSESDTGSLARRVAHRFHIGISLTDGRL